MIIGEVVELLIRLRDDIQLDRRTDDAVCAACNLLDELPRLSTVDDVLKILKNSRNDLNG